jgi:hypothetical protein
MVTSNGDVIGVLEFRLWRGMGWEKAEGWTPAETDTSRPERAQILVATGRYE